MKIKLFGLLIIATLCSFNLDNVYVWEKYKIQITVPDDFEVTENTDENFAMVGDGMELSIGIFKGSISLNDLENATIEGAQSIKMTEIDQAHATKINQLEGFFVEGYLDGDRVLFTGLSDVRTKTNMFVAITFADHDENAEEEAFKILNSIKRLR